MFQTKNKQVVCKPPLKQAQAKLEGLDGLRKASAPELIKLEVLVLAEDDFIKGDCIFVRPGNQQYLKDVFQTAIDGEVTQFIIVPSAEVVGWEDNT